MPRWCGSHVQTPQDRDLLLVCGPGTSSLCPSIADHHGVDERRTRGSLLGLPCWPKTRALSPPMCAMLIPRHATLACATWQRGFVSPQQGCLRRHAFPREDAYGQNRISRRDPLQHPHDGCGVWGLGRSPGRRRRARCAPWSASSRPRRSPRLSRRRSSRLYRDPACRAPERRGGAHDPLAADRVLDLAATLWRCKAASFSRRRAPAAVAHVRDPAPGRGRALWGAAASCRWGRSSRPCRIPGLRRVTGSSTDPAWHARLEACGIRTRRSRYEGTKARPAFPRSSWMRRRAGGSPRSPSGQGPFPGGRYRSSRESRTADHGRPPARPGAGCGPL